MVKVLYNVLRQHGRKDKITNKQSHSACMLILPDLKSYSFNGSDRSDGRIRCGRQKHIKKGEQETKNFEKETEDIKNEANEEVGNRSEQQWEKNMTRRIFWTMIVNI